MILTDDDFEAKKKNIREIEDCYNIEMQCTFSDTNILT